MSEPLTFKAQISPLQSAMQHGPDGMLVKLIPQGINEEMAGDLFRLQERALTLTVKDVMGDFSVNASIPDTASAVRINKKSPQVMFHIPRGDVLTGLRLVALFGVVFTVEIDGSGDKPKAKKASEKPAKGPHSEFWRRFCAGGRFNSLDLWQVLGVDSSKDAEEALRKSFNVSSRTFIAPADFIAWLDKSELHFLATEARRLEAQANA